VRQQEPFASWSLQPFTASTPQTQGASWWAIPERWGWPEGKITTACQHFASLCIRAEEPVAITIRCPDGGQCIPQRVEGCWWLSSASKEKKGCAVAKRWPRSATPQEVAQRP
jgi:hypothetical protein